MIMPPHEDENWDAATEHETEHPNLYRELRSLLQRYGYTNMLEALDNINDEG